MYGSGSSPKPPNSAINANPEVASTDQLRTTTHYDTTAGATSQGRLDYSVSAQTEDYKAPAIYYLYPMLAGPPGGWGEHFHRAKEMGFDAILLASPFAAGMKIPTAGPPPAVTDYSVIHDVPGGGDSSVAIVLAADLARSEGLKLFLDLDISVVDAESIRITEHPDWFEPSAPGAALQFGAENNACDNWWDERIKLLQAAGVSGFRCTGLEKILQAVWRRITSAAKERVPSTVFMAWTPGLAPPAIAALRGSGFDFAFSSSSWWDFKAGWLDQDAERVALIGPAIAMAEPLDDFRCADLDAEGRASRRALMFAAHYSPGWLVPMGFEYGAGSWLHRLPADDRPGAFKRLQRAPSFELTEQITQANAARRHRGDAKSKASARLISSPDAKLAVLARPRAEGNALVLAINPSLVDKAQMPAASFLPLLGDAGVTLAGLGINAAQELTPASSFVLTPGEVALFDAVPLPPIVIAGAPLPDCASPRIAIEAISPKVDDGEFPVRRIVGETVVVEADILTDGHGKLAADLLWRCADRSDWRSAPMEPVGNDRWRAEFPLERMGRYVFAVTAWWDDYATCIDAIAKKHAAGISTHLEIQEGLSLIARAAAGNDGKAEAGLSDLVGGLRSADEEAIRTTLLSPTVVDQMRRSDIRRFPATSGNVVLDAERKAAAFASWYEIFPRSQSGDATRHGTFEDVICRLPAIQAMGFDVLYFPPIHPIGRINRKGRNNSLTAGLGDPGSPYAIGATEGGHDVIHAELGTLAEFRKLVPVAAEYGIEIALDFAIQCAPDHPWLKTHPEWFDWQSDGSLRYAENPPKKYEDIVNVDFYTEGATPSLWLALRDVVEFWVDQGIRMFRVDNPHTKPLPFWQWMIGDIRARHPEVIFLAEAFTRPKIMYRLAKIGFSQSYTYFTWRNTKQELTEYLTELTTTAPRDFFRPHFFVNTPDINPLFLQTSGRAGFLIRAALAATLSGLWGVYNGFELCESSAIPGKEEYMNSEKYAIRAWDYDRPGNIIAEISGLNRIRRENSALHRHVGLEFLKAESDQILAFVKIGADGNTIYVALNLDPLSDHQAEIELPLWKFGLSDDGVLHVDDLMRDKSFTLRGKTQRIHLSPFELPFHIWRLRASVSSPN